MKRLLVILVLVISLVGTSYAEDAPINGGTPVYPTETTLVVTSIPTTIPTTIPAAPVVTDTPLTVTPTLLEEQPDKKLITKESFVYKENSKSEIKEKPLITINITPYLSSGKKLDRKVHEKELPLDTVVTTMVEHLNGGVKKTKLVQIYPETTLEISDDAETIKQSSPNGGKMKHEIYYGYQKSATRPWSQYYKVENCDATKCRVVTADFISRVVTVRTIPIDNANAITGIPGYEALP